MQILLEKNAMIKIKKSTAIKWSYKKIVNEFFYCEDTMKFDENKTNDETSSTKTSLRVIIKDVFTTDFIYLSR